MKDWEGIPLGIKVRSVEGPKPQVLVEPEGQLILFIHIDQVGTECFHGEPDQPPASPMASEIRVNEQHFDPGPFHTQKGIWRSDDIPEAVNGGELSQARFHQGHE